MEIISMVELLSNLISGKRVLLLGFGMEGQSTYSLLKEIGTFSKLDIADINPLKNISDSIVYSGADYLDYINNYDVAFKSPGLVLPKNYHDYNCIITSQTEMFLHAFSNNVIGVTGTKGKSTVCSLLYHVLSTNGIECILAGNIGTPVFSIVKDIKPETKVVLELSCHQLEICEFSPAVAVLLNIFQDHLDHYGTYEKYVKAKKNIYIHQHPNDVLYCDDSVKPRRDESVSRTNIVKKDILPFDSLEGIDGVMLRGKNNLVNCAFVYSISKSFGVTDEEFITSLQSYLPLRHRLEFLGSINGVDYYDDSISTTVESSISAIESIPNTSTILLGGMDRGIDYAALVKYISNSKVSNIICMYESGKRIFEMLMACEDIGPRITYCKDLFEATQLAKKATQKGTACILSPASASYGDFKNFEERGNVFKSILFEKYFDTPHS